MLNCNCIQVPSPSKSPPGRPRPHNFLSLGGAHTRDSIGFALGGRVGELQTVWAHNERCGARTNSRSGSLRSLPLTDFNDRRKHRKAAFLKQIPRFHILNLSVRARHHLFLLQGYFVVHQLTLCSACRRFRAHRPRERPCERCHLPPLSRCHRLQFRAPSQTLAATVSQYDA